MGKYPGKEEEMNGNLALLIPIIGVFIPIAAIVSVFTMIIFAIRFGTQRKEREAFYRAENLRRITESSGEGAKAAIELMKEEEHLKRIKAREGMKLGGLVCVAVGIALLIFLRVLVHEEPVYLCGLIPAFVGVALLVYVFFMAPPVE
jgi:mannose/fructose/N-acetylgalactosamine-specific phosphotransferase system component IIC